MLQKEISKFGLEHCKKVTSNLNKKGASKNYYVPPSCKTSFEIHLESQSKLICFWECEMSLYIISYSTFFY